MGKKFPVLRILVLNNCEDDMTIPMLMMQPSVWMQKTFFEIAEGLRGRKIGEEGPCEGGKCEIAVRVTAAAHAALQFLYASLMIVPICFVTAVTILFQPLSTGFFTEHGKVLERLALGVAAAVGSLLIPGCASIATAVVPRQLSDLRSPAVVFPIASHAYLFSFVHPTLEEKCVATLSSDYDFYNLSSLLSPGISLSTMLRRIFPLLEEQLYRWRVHLPPSILDQVNDGFLEVVAYDRVFDNFSDEFNLICVVAISRAAGDAVGGGISDEWLRDLRAALT